MNPLLTDCPVCHTPLVVKRLVCPACETAIEGEFYSNSSPASGEAPAAASSTAMPFSPAQLEKLAPFARLTTDQLDFVVTFLRCEGRFNRLEEEMRLSYPTLRGRFDEIVRALGYEPAQEEVAPTLNLEERQRILTELENGQITPQDAKRQLRELGNNLKQSLRKSIRDSIRGI